MSVKYMTKVKITRNEYTTNKIQALDLASVCQVDSPVIRDTNKTLPELGLLK